MHDLSLPLQGLFKKNLPSESDTAVFGGTQALKENQLASVFLRWAPPEADSKHTPNTDAKITR